MTWGRVYLPIQQSQSDVYVFITAAAKNLAQGRSVKNGQSNMNSGAAVVCTTFRDTFWDKKGGGGVGRSSFSHDQGGGRDSERNDCTKRQKQQA